MKNYPEESTAWDICEAVVFWSVCVAGAVASIYFGAYFLSILIWG